VHIEVKKEASKRPWVAGFVYLLRPLLLVPSARLATSVERKGGARQGAGGRNGMRNGRERKRRQGRERPGRDGGRPLVGRASEFRPPSLWGRPHGVTVARFESRVG